MNLPFLEGCAPSPNCKERVVSLAMRVRVSSIPPDGLHIKDALPLDALNERMKLGSADATRFVSPPSVDITVKPTGNGAVLSGRLAAKYKQPCSLCDEGIERELQIPVKYLLLEQTGDDAEDDIGTIFYTGDVVDLEDVLQEALIVKLFPYWHPEVLPDGKCSVCARSFEGLVELAAEEPASEDAARTGNATERPRLNGASHTEGGIKLGELLDEAMKTGKARRR